VSPTASSIISTSVPRLVTVPTAVLARSLRLLAVFPERSNAAAAPATARDALEPRPLAGGILVMISAEILGTEVCNSSQLWRKERRKRLSSSAHSMGQPFI